ncbi:MAG: 3-keto-5-aminohexanoate cleavage protein [Chloroflexi bacterium]|nr:3-keto-5-aminohexanoate cleavage protein [Chloroflexota bacterium]
MDKLIVTVAVTGAFPTRRNSPYIPYTTREIADEAIRAWEAGAAVAHIHMREDNGRPSADIDRFAETIDYIRARCDIVINATTGGGHTSGIAAEDRLAVVPRCKPEMASLDVGAITLGTYDKQQWKWVVDGVSGLTFSQLHHFAEVMREHEVKPEVEIFDVSGIHAANLLIEAGALTPPLQYGLVLGMAGQMIPASVKNLLFLVETLPPGSIWTCIAIGRHQFTLGSVAVVLGGHVRVGFEDNVYLSKGVLAKSNAELVEKMVNIADQLGRDVASPAEARRILGLPEKA